MIVRLRFSKRGPVRYISHRDVARAWERAFRRAGLPVTFTQGFSPHPRVSFGLALPLGYESDAEYLDVTLAERGDAADVARRLDAVLPEGMSVEAAREVDPSAPSVASIVEWADYVVALSGPDEGDPPSRSALEDGLRALEAVDRWIVPRRKKGREVAGSTEDVRLLVNGVTVADAPADLGPVALSMRLATQPRVVRPDEVCELLTKHHPAAACEPRLVRRTAQLLFVEGVPVDPMAPDAAITSPSNRPDDDPMGVSGEKASLPLHAEIPTST